MEKGGWVGVFKITEKGCCFGKGVLKGPYFYQKGFSAIAVMFKKGVWWGKFFPPKSLGFLLGGFNGQSGACFLMVFGGCHSPNPKIYPPSNIGGGWFGRIPH
ncbi:MAG: hypothetical protein H0A76_05795 [Candidatus Thiodubiliella endoseptemdiera]|uniref:Uncharacterized protein n=1 Tax=Candidatus Thiodubiliella endoseptemdiera TaxID=2738886 RepID=A0A853F384_9GAMM|nr:hypothetical protein [Candidatus Thiodubiliella endoseptemdiera]